MNPTPIRPKYVKNKYAGRKAEEQIIEIEAVQGPNIDDEH